MITRKLISAVFVPAFLFVATCVLAADTTPPTGTIKINNDAAYTNTVAVTLNLSAIDTGSGLSQMKFSNNNFTWSIAESYATTKSWTIASNNGTRTVYVRYKDIAGNWSGNYSDTIVLDTIVPTAPVVTDDGAVTQDFTKLHAKWTAATDAGSGIDRYECWVSDGTAGGLSITGTKVTVSAATIDYTITGLALIRGKTYYYNVAAIDKAGNAAIGSANGMRAIK